MYMVGFYAAQPKAGVTQVSLSVFNQLKQDKSLSVAFVASGKLESEQLSDKLIHCFSDLTTKEQVTKFNRLRKKCDILIYDASGVSLEAAQVLLPVADRLLIFGDAAGEYAATLYNLIGFHKMFDANARDLVNQLHNDGAFVLNHTPNTVGFAPSTNADDIAKLITRDHSIYKLHQIYIKKQQQMVAKIKKSGISKLRKVVLEVGMPFDKSLMFEKYVQLRLALGQNMQDAISELFPYFLQNEYDELLKRFHSELGVAQINFSHQSKGAPEQ